MESSLTQRNGLNRDEVFSRLGQLKRQVGPAFRYVEVGFSSSNGTELGPLAFKLNKGLLRRAEQEDQTSGITVEALAQPAI